jgi:hypothetical protein
MYVYISPNKLCDNGSVCSWVPRTLMCSNTAQGSTYIRLPLYCIVLDNRTGKVRTTLNWGAFACPICRGNVVRITYSECMPLALVTRHAKRMGHNILSSVAYLVLTYFSTLSHEGQGFRKRLTELNMCALIFSKNTSETFLILRRIQPYIIIIVKKVLM